MAEKKITRKVISPSKKGRSMDERVASSKKTEEVAEQAETVSKEGEVKTKKVCSFCQGKTCPSYTDVAVLRRFLSDRAKIVSRAKTGLCSKHQRLVTRQIKYARHLAILPFTPKV